MIVPRNFSCTFYSTTVERCPGNPMLGHREIVNDKVNKILEIDVGLTLGGLRMLLYDLF
jgi:hypothetical protein